VSGVGKEPTCVPRSDSSAADGLSRTDRAWVGGLLTSTIARIVHRRLEWNNEG
jgi:hypothetical protein